MVVGYWRVNARHAGKARGRKHAMPNMSPDSVAVSYNVQIVYSGGELMLADCEWMVPDAWSVARHMYNFLSNEPFREAISSQGRKHTSE